MSTPVIKSITFDDEPSVNKAAPIEAERLPAAVPKEAKPKKDKKVLPTAEENENWLKVNSNKPLIQRLLQTKKLKANKSGVSVLSLQTSQWDEILSSFNNIRVPSKVKLVVNDKTVQELLL